MPQAIISVQAATILYLYSCLPAPYKLSFSIVIWWCWKEVNGQDEHFNIILSLLTSGLSKPPPASSKRCSIAPHFMLPR